MYCKGTGNSGPTGLCSAGFYCPGGSSLPTPSDGVTGGRCPPGSYCPAGTGMPQPCPRGTFSEKSGLTDPSQCQVCKPGYFCSEPGQTAVTGPCLPGFYCLEGSPSSAPTSEAFGGICSPGHFCEGGSGVPSPCPEGTHRREGGGRARADCTPCPAGWYQALSGQPECESCPPGFYCSPAVLEPRGAVVPLPCPSGHFCPRGTPFGTRNPCPEGTYSRILGLTSSAQCSQCPEGRFCGSQGLAEPTGTCSPGFLCIAGARLPNPRDNVTGMACPRGHYCQHGLVSGSCSAGFLCDWGSSSPEQRPCPAGFYCPRGTQTAIPCAAGTFSPVTGNSQRSDCTLCPAGQYCQGSASAAPDGLCSVGFYCPPGQTSPTPAAFRCPSGHSCPPGSPAPQPCDIGSFQAQQQGESCDLCPAGFYCHSLEEGGVVQPAICPRGYYCPPGTGVGTEYPCPRGTIGPQSGATSVLDCQLCPAGMYCAFHGLFQATGPCQAGYYCPPGSSSPNSTEYMVKADGASARKNLCPAGHFCPAGTGYPLPCPPGSYSSFLGLSRAEQCQPCPPGRFCDRPALTHPEEAPPCDSGYVCLGGSVSARPTDGLHGYLCASGFHCPMGTGAALPCEPGTYGPMPGAAACLPCPPGTMCNSTSAEQPAVCPAGHFCPPKTATPLPCPVGTLNSLPGAQSSSACVPCPAGLYCSTEGAHEPHGECLAGYYCQGGATYAVPQGSAKFPRNGPCPEGHYCPAGAPSPLPCPVGTIRNSTGGSSMESCLPCPAGHYCAREGQASPSGTCAAGFYCPSTSTSISPHAFLCPKGHYCPPGSAHAVPCPTGEYQPNPGSDYCVPCRPGFYCEEAVTGDPHSCPPHSYCPAATQVPQLCPRGTFTPPEQGGLQEEQECLPCPPGRFCRGGRIQGRCAAGFLCVSGSSEFTPQGPVLQDWSGCEGGESCASPCPAGFYCPEGSEQPKACPSHTIRASPGASRREDCVPCPAKHWCKEGDPTHYLCPPGHYCDELTGNSTEGAAGPRECPLHTYRAAPGAGSRGECQTCPAGYHCDSTGLTDYAGRPCPPGFWCSGTGSPVPCPAGTMRPQPGGASPSQCEPCRAGTYCPDPGQTGRPNIYGTPCRPAYQCPPGSMMETPCRAGSYCRPQTGLPASCPGGYFCAEGSETYDTPQQQCLFPYYCPANSSAPLSCDGGFMPVNVSGPRDSRDKSCRPCEAGTYRPSVASQLACLPCPSGYHCPAGTELYLSNPCPVGHYCPLGSALPVPCPPGSYGSITRAKHRGECNPCPPGTFNHLFAQKACFPCGSSSFSLAGAASCTCLGLNRAFQQSDGTCVCRTGFVFYNELDQKSSFSDSDLDCQPEVSERCRAGQVRLAASRQCVSPAEYPCAAACGAAGGSLSAELGVCHCKQYVSAEELCDASCLSRVPRISASFGSDGQLVLNIRDKETRNAWSRPVGDVLSPDVQVQASDNVHLVQFGPEGVFGWILTDSSLVDTFLSGLGRASEVSADSRFRKKRASSGDMETNRTSLSRIPNPIACIQPDDMLLFQCTISHSNRSLSHFPIYQKDHLFSSNPSWDFGAFRRLEHLIKETQLNSSRFAHVFSEAGRYVFLDNAVPERSLVVVVTERGAECHPRAAAFQPSSPVQLVRHGVLKRHRLNLQPDWSAIAGVLGFLALVVVVLTTSALVLKPAHTHLNPLRKYRPKWRSLGEPSIPAGYICSGGSWESPTTPGTRVVGEGAEAEEPAVFKGEVRKGPRELEDFNVKTLYDKLEDQTLYLTSQLSKHRRDTQEFYKNICQQIDTAKEIVEQLSSTELTQLGKALGAGSPSGDGVKTTNRSSTDPEGQPLTDSSVQLMEAVLRALEGVAFRVDCENTLLQHLTKERSQAESRNCKAFQESLYNSSLDVFDPKRTPGPEPFPPSSAGQLPSAAPGVSERDLGDLLALTPLSRTLQQIQESLQSCSCLEKVFPAQPVPEVPGEPTGADLVPADVSELPPRHFAVFLFGCHALRLLTSTCGFPPVTLLLAQAVPSRTRERPGPESYCCGDFYYDRTNQILYLRKAKLDSAGEFIAILLHSMAFIASGTETREFMRAFHQAVSAISTALFYSHCDITEETTKRNKPREKWHRAAPTFREDFFAMKVPPDARFTQERLAERLNRFKCFRLYQHLKDMKQDAEKETVPTQGDKVLQAESIEHEIDGLNELFLQVTTQLQKQAEHSKHLEEQLRDQEEPALGEMEEVLRALASSRSEALVLEMKRRCLSQRLEEAHSRLAEIGAQPHDN
ncbi:neurogenic locus notch homolog protein 3 isoform X1 [Lepisosteus oculatus]|uniref:neurogenic locus notch homolog protein 3 isoform X1 n=1 Tax=Lepisosteus oculatus TaxID=7918 RepID=UPI0037185611